MACGVVEVNSIVGEGATSAEWYLGLIRRLSRSLGLSMKVLPWWRERDGLSPVQRFSEFVEDVLLNELSGPIVIFIDEIDSLFKFDFNDDFFALIRSFYQERSDLNAFDRLSFVLLGVATPNDLIRDKTRTSFNIGGRLIDLKGFQATEINPLAAGLAGLAENPVAVLHEILHWTKGQPFLTQRLCELIATSKFTIAAGSEAELVAQLVQSRVIDDWEAQDVSVHLKTIRDRILADEERTGRLLGLYQRILQSEDVAADGSDEQIELRLSGLIREEQNFLRVANPIYRAVFGQGWIDAGLLKLRPYGTAIAAWVASRRRDEALLLQGEALQRARGWAAGKRLSDDDRLFLDASQELGRRELKKVLSAEQQAKIILEDANQKAEARLKSADEQLQVTELQLQEQEEKLTRASRKIGLGSIALATTLIGAVVSGIIASKQVAIADNARSQRQKITNENQKLLDRNRNLDGENRTLGKEIQGNKASIRKFEQEIGLLNQDLTSAQEKEQQAIQQAQVAQTQIQQAANELSKIESENQQAKDSFLDALITQQQLESSLDTIESELNQRRQELIEIDNGFRLAQQAVSESFNDIPSGISQQTGQNPAIIYISFFPDESGDENLGLMMVSSDGPVFETVDLPNQETFLQIANKFRIIISDVFRNDYLDESQQLYKWLIKPLESHLEQQKINNILFVVDKRIRDLPFAALHDGQNFLIEKYSIAMMPGLALTNVQYRGLENADILALGISSPDQNYTYPQLSSLPAVEKEIENISNVWRGDFYLNEEATIEKIIHRNEKAKIIHIASAGGYSNSSLGVDNNAENPFIMLWGQPLLSGQLTDIDFYSPLVELLVLSACDVGLGEDYGLAGSAIRAGVKSVIGTISVIEDESTAELMTRFYQELSEGYAKSEALRRAQIAMLTKPNVRNRMNEKAEIEVSPFYIDGSTHDSRTDDYLHPYYWANYLIIGSPW